MSFLGFSESLFNQDMPLFLKLFFFTALIVIYAVFVFYFYRFMAKKNIIKLNLNQYNNYESPRLVKFFAGLFYILEYVILLPVVTSFWFVFLAIFILVLSEGISLSMVLLVSTALVASVRITSYVSEDLSRDLAKMVPFTLAVIAITKPSFFVIEDLFLRVSEVPLLLSSILYYLIFIISIELIMRVGDLIYEASRSSDDP